MIKTLDKFKSHIRLVFKLIIFKFFGILIFSCSGPNEQNKSTQKIFSEQETKQKTQLNLGTFGYLEDVMGCGCYLATDSIQFRQQEFVYAEKYGLPDGSGFGFIRLNNELARLEVISVENDPQGMFRKVRLGNDSLEVWLDLDIKPNQDPEVLPIQGSLQIHFENQAAINETVYGVCGC
jgi:hypothetical protein